MSINVKVLKKKKKNEHVESIASWTVMHRDQAECIPGAGGDSTQEKQPTEHTTPTERKGGEHDHWNLCRKSKWQNATSFHKKNIQQTRNIRKLPAHNKGQMWKTEARIIRSNEWLNTSTLTSRTRQECPLQPPPFNILLDVVSRAVRQERQRIYERKI